ncbi:hypothetical protein ACIGG9_16035 [Pseudonocardia alni]|uniref:hypothetical protein n=1 Tax=Pseudonocardia alni TaxID=33907 RepID=UPI0033EA0359
MYAVATCRGSILRGTTTDAYGDESDVATVVATGVLACLREVSSRIFDHATQTPRQVRRTTAQVPSATDIRVGDRFRDDRHDVVYEVLNVARPGGPGRVPDQEVELRRTT